MVVTSEALEDTVEAKKTPFHYRLFHAMALYKFIAIVRPHRLHSVHAMRPVATDRIAWSVCVSVSHVRLKTSRCRWGGVTGTMY